MPTPTPSDPHPPGKDVHLVDPKAVPAAPSTEENFRKFWEKNARTVYAGCAVLLLTIVGKAAYNSYAEHRREVLAGEYKVAEKTNKLPSFISEHPGEPLAGLAELNLADQAYKAGKYADASSGYQRSAEILKTGPLAGRALLGAATCNIFLNKVDVGVEKLKQVANDVNQLKGIRAEAAFKVASLAAEGAKTDEAVKYLDLTNTIDPAGNWAQQGLLLRSTLPASATKPEAAAPSVSIKLPTKKP